MMPFSSQIAIMVPLERRTSSVSRSWVARDLAMQRDEPARRQRPARHHQQRRAHDDDDQHR